ncbi:hypothetical protein GCM10022214_78760 [Actinomadura miaoliensis]|uniref:Uncharacterized protein n=1 Tax=Actinomadura miaoliensis TaxID=430685 RepID=A0ABP7X2S5_9ACTN
MVGAASRRSGSSPVLAASCQSTSTARGATRRASAARCRLANPGAGRARLGARARDDGLDTEDVDTAERTLRRRSLAGDSVIGGRPRERAAGV